MPSRTTCRSFLSCRLSICALDALQDEKEHAQTKAAVNEFLENDELKTQEKWKKWAETKDRSKPS